MYCSVSWGKHTLNPFVPPPVLKSCLCRKFDVEEMKLSGQVSIILQESIHFGLGSRVYTRMKYRMLIIHI